MLDFVTRRYDKKSALNSISRQSTGGERMLPFGYSTSLAFARSGLDNTYSEFLKYSNAELAKGNYFDAFIQWQEINRDGNRIIFQSDIKTDHDANNNVVCVYDRCERADHAVVVVNHWFARDRYPGFARYFNSRGMSVVQVPLPYHFERRLDGPLGEQRALSADLGVTLHSMRQAVLDTRKVIRWLQGQGYRSFSVVGMCLGGVVAGLVAAHEPLVRKAVLMVSCGSVADAVWTGETLVALRRRIERHLTLDELRSVWSLIDLENYTSQLSRDDLSLMFVLGRNDTVVRPEVTQRLLDGLQSEGCSPKVQRLRCGHFSLGMFPYNLQSAWSVSRFLEYRGSHPWYALTPEGL